jgi:DNA-binding transcriptional LysR family regulator
VKDIGRTDLTLLVVLDALLEERSVTRAAVRLAVTQPTVSGMLVRLRKLFDDPLFVRTQRGLLPTPRAQALAPSLRQWLAEACTLVVGAAFDPGSSRTSAPAHLGQAELRRCSRSNSRPQISSSSSHRISG